MFMCRRGSLYFLSFVLSAILMVGGFSPLQGEPDKTKDKPAEVPGKPANAAEESISQALKKLREQRGLASETVSKLEDALGKSTEQIGKAKDREARARENHEFLAAAPALVAKIREELNREKFSVRLDLASSTLQQTEQLLAKYEAEAKVLKEKLSETEREIETLNLRRIELPKLLATAKGYLESLTQEDASGKAPSVTPESEEVSKLFRESSLRLAKAEVDLYESELETADLRLEYAKVRREQCSRRGIDLEGLIKFVRETTNAKRKREVDLAAQKAMEDLQASANALPPVKSLAEENAGIAEKRKELAEKLEDLTQESARSSKLLGKLKDDYKSIRDRLAVTGYSDVVGLLLRVRRSELPNADGFASSMARRKRLISGVQLELIELEELMALIPDTQEVIREALDKLGETVTKEQQGIIRETLRQLHESRRKGLETLAGDLNAYFNRLVDLDSIQFQLLKILKEYADYIDERILWIRSCQPLRFADFPRAAQGLAWLFAPAKWLNVLSCAWREFLDSPLIWTLLFLLPAMLLRLRQRAFDWISEHSIRAHRGTVESLVFTLQTLFLTAIISGIWPFFFFFLSFLLNGPGDNDSFTRSVGNAFFRTAAGFWAMEFLRDLFIKKGLANIHFDWHLERLSSKIRRKITLIMFFFFPAYLFGGVLFGQEFNNYHENLGRFLFFIQLLAPVFLLRRFLFPTGELFSTLASFSERNIVYKGRYVIYFLFVLVPVGLAIASGMGYQYTAYQLFRRTLYSISLIIGIVILFSIIFRAFRIHHTNISRQHQTLKKEGREADAPNPDSFVRESEVVNVLSDSQELNIFSLGHQTQRLFLSLTVFATLVGLWYIWEDVLPAIKILNQVKLWTATVQVTETEAGADGIGGKILTSRVANITLLHLILAVGCMALTILGSRAIPGLVEISILQRLQLDAGVRYAIRTLTGYVINIIGLIVSFQIIGVGWEKVQWLAAAISVGLGFGLQEIFANFVSGLIILFERPIRVGDIITVGDISGTVSKIEIRATTVVDWDRKELIIPNKEFITGKVVNWTLTDTVSRVVFKVCAAYGSDPDLVRKTLVHVATANPRVMQNPAPQAIFLNFGAYSMDFELRVHIPSLDSYSDLVHEINSSIDRAFREKGIKIPVPRHEVNVAPSDSSALSSAVHPTKKKPPRE